MTHPGETAADGGHGRRRRRRLHRSVEIVIEMSRDAASGERGRGNFEDEIAREKRHFHANFEHVVGVALFRVIVAAEEVRVQSVIVRRVGRRRRRGRREFGIGTSGGVFGQVEIDETKLFLAATTFRFSPEGYSTS